MSDEQTGNTDNTVTTPIPMSRGERVLIEGRIDEVEEKANQAASEAKSAWWRAQRAWIGVRVALFAIACVVAFLLLSYC